MCDLICYLLIAGALYGAYLYLQKLWVQKKLDRFSKANCPKDKVIIHGTRRATTIPAPSPFVLKLETYMRMTKIDYEYDGDRRNTFGPKGKTPWISLNGEHVSDSQLCIEFLEKKFNKQIKNNYTEKEQAIAHMIRVLLEDRVFWEIVLWGFAWGGEGPKAVQKVLGVPWLIVKYLGYHYNKLSWSQGMGRHTKEEVEPWTHKDIKTLAVILGNNKFLLGDEPCVEDCAFFGFAAQMFWGFPATSPYIKAAKEKYPNIEAYCIRMRDRYFPDWDELLKKAKSS